MGIRSKNWFWFCFVFLFLLYAGIGYNVGYRAGKSAADRWWFQKIQLQIHYIAIEPKDCTIQQHLPIGIEPNAKPWMVSCLEINGTARTIHPNWDVPECWPPRESH